MPPPSDAVSPFTSDDDSERGKPSKGDHCGDAPGTDTEHAEKSRWGMRSGLVCAEEMREI